MNNKKVYLSKKYVIPALLILVAAGITITMISMHRSRNRHNVVGGIIQEGVISGYTEDEIKAIMQRKADESAFSFEINSRPIFENGRSEGNLRIANPPYNKYSIEVEIKLDSNEKTIFKSGKIEPMHYIENAKLSSNLKAGEYDATAIINAYDTETGEYKGTSAAKLIISINN